MDIGLLAMVLSLKAMLFNLIYNWIFDLLDAGSCAEIRSRTLA